MANFYSIKNLLSTKAQYMMLLGQRANGKSYQCKLTVLTDAYKNGNKFVYLRRWREDIKGKYVEEYFEDMDISKITKGEFTEVIAHNGFLYFGNVDEDGKLVKGAEIGRYCALNEAERYKSQTFVGYKWIVFEEFITDKIYITDEPRQLQQFVSTVARLKAVTVLLVGNTLSRVCPYFFEFSLEPVLKMKPGTIEVFHHHVGENIIDVAVEYCANADNKNLMFFGQASKQIITGEWDTKDMPKLPKKQSDYELLYELLVRYQKFTFCLQLLAEKSEGGLVVFVYPFNGVRNIDRVITDEHSDSIWVSAQLDTSRRPEALINKCFKTGKVFYSDNLTGSDFINVNNVFHLGSVV